MPPVGYAGTITALDAVLMSFAPLLSTRAHETDGDGRIAIWLTAEPFE